jgi:hypothetical protein
MTDGNPDTPVPTGPAADHLKWIGPEDDDTKLVTEPLSKMQPWMHRALLAWFVLLSAMSVTYMVSRWPESPQRQWRTKADSLAVVIQRIKSINEVVLADSARVMIQRELARPSRPTEPSKSTGEPLSDKVLFKIALLCGILGGAVHGLSSLMDFRGARRLFRSWGLWYFALPLLGGATAVIFFVTLRAGLLPNSTAVEDLNPFGVGAVSALVGLCTDKATTRLAQVLETLFLAKGVDREGKLTPANSTPAGGKTQ